MTALDQYQRLECTALWRDAKGAQLREVIVALGDASLVLSDKAGRPLSHWSLPAVICVNPGDSPALYRPGIDAEEELEIEDPLMAEGIETVRTALAARRNRPGRLRTGIVAGLALLTTALALFWLPGAMLRYTASVVPDVKRAEIGTEILDHIHRVTGGECRDPLSDAALRKLWSRLGLASGQGRIAVLADGTRATAHLPGQIVLVNRKLVEDYDTPEVLAAFVALEATRMAVRDPLLDLLDHAGLGATFRLLTTGDLAPDNLVAYGEDLLTGRSTDLPTTTILAAFENMEIPARPYAYAIDFTGETTFDLIEADTFDNGASPNLLPDADWVQLQGVCGA